MYESPISIVHRRIEQSSKDAIENAVYNAVLEVCVGVDKNELIKALTYDCDQYNRGYTDGTADATPKWISVKDRLPEAFVSVLVQMPGEVPHPTVREGYISNEGVWVSGYYRREPDEVTHWMPLPEPPKEAIT